EGLELAIENGSTLVVEGRVGLVEHEEPGIVEQRAAAREPLRHPPRIRGDALVAGIPEPEALEQHANPLTTLGNAIEASVEVEVLEGGQVPVDERLVPDEAEP